MPDAKLRPRRMNKKLVWLIWVATALLAAYVLLYYVGYYFGDVGA